MPIGLVIALGAAAVSTASVGVGKSIKGGIDQKDAKNTNERANEIVDAAKKAVERSRNYSSEAINALGYRKIEILDNSIKPFIDSFEKIHNIELIESEGLSELHNLKLDKQSLNELKEMSSMASSLIGGVASGATLGAVAAFGAYSAAMTFGSCATTGTAIATLSGVAAKNATLAFLGGGALSVGGLGMAGGAVVLGGLVAAPALAVMGFIIGAKASANKEAAYANLANAKEFEEEAKTIQVLCKVIRTRATMFECLLIRLNSIFLPLVYKLQNIISTSGCDYSKYNQQQKEIVAACLSMATAIKAVLDTPILTEDGLPTKGSENFISATNSISAESSVQDVSNLLKAVPSQSENKESSFKKDNKADIKTKKIIELVEEYLKRESVSGRLTVVMDNEYYSKIQAAFNLESFNETRDTVIGIFDPSIANCITGKVSGLLFSKERILYKDTADSVPVSFRYCNMKRVEQKFSSLILYGKNGTTIKLKGVSYAVDSTYAVFDGIRSAISK